MADILPQVSEYDGSYVHTECAVAMGRTAEDTPWYAIESDDPEFRCQFCDHSFDITSL